MDENNSLKALLLDLFKGEIDNLNNRISPDKMQEKIGDKRIEIDGVIYYQETEWGDLTYTHDENYDIIIGKLKVYHLDDSIEYLYQAGNCYNENWISRKRSIFIFEFGKYINQPIYDVIIIDPNYILWCIINLDHFLISEELLRVVLENADNTTDNIKEGVEINLIKLQLIEMYEGCLEGIREDIEEMRQEEAKEDGIKNYYKGYGFGEGGGNEGIGYWNTE